MLTKHEAQIDDTFSGGFTKDDSVSTGSAEPDDHRSTGFDRGHLSPAADNEATYRQSHLMSNMSPQLPTFNQGIWKRLETWVRDNAIAFDTVYVVTGPIFKHNLGQVGVNQVTIPGYYYKGLLRFEDDGTPHLLGFPATPCGRRRTSRRVCSAYQYHRDVNRTGSLSSFTR